MCSGLMDGRDLSVGAVGAIRNVRNPVSVAKRLLPEKEILLVGEGATMFAKKAGVEMVPEEALMTETRREALEQMHDTVGAVAMDKGGNLAAGTSTGGLTGAKVGRIGDSPLPGNGLYADNHVGAVSFSGDGESIARLALAAQVMASIGRDGPEEAVRKAVEQLPGVGGSGGDGGGIAIAKDGRIGWAHNSSAFAIAYASGDSREPKAFLSKEEERRG
ncbi:MAG TPA: isoaspartyl peptidase/L-asparaginase, partial [Allosphingosinicella sp.]